MPALREDEAVEKDPFRRSYYTYNHRRRRQGLPNLSFQEYLDYVMARDTALWLKRRNNKREPELSRNRTAEHGILSAKVAATDNTDNHSHLLDKMVRQESGLTYRAYHVAVGEGCWRKTHRPRYW